MVGQISRKGRTKQTFEEEEGDKQQREVPKALPALLCIPSLRPSCISHILIINSPPHLCWS